MSFGLTIGGPRSFVLLLLLFEDPGMGTIGDFRQGEQVFTTKRVRRFPLLAVFVASGKLGVEANSSFPFVAPDGGPNGAKTDFVGGFVAIWFGSGHRFLHKMMVGHELGFRAARNQSREALSCSLLLWAECYRGTS